MKIRTFISLLLTFILIAASSVHAQGTAAAIFGPPKKEEAAEAAPPVKDAFGRETPRGTLQGFIDAIGKSDYDRAANYLNLSYLSKRDAKKQGPKLAKNLQELMDNGAWVLPASMVSDDPAGKHDDGLSDELERLGSLRANKDTADLLIARTGDESGAQIWLISEDTTKKIPTLIKHLKATWIDRILPDSLIDRKMAGVPVGHWAAMIGLMGAAYICAWVIIRLLAMIVRRLWKNTDPDRKAHVIDAFELPLRLYISTWFFVVSAIEIGISVVARQYFSRLTIIVAWIALALLMWKLIDVISETSERKLISKGKYGALSGVSFFRRMAKFFFLALATFITLDTVGIDVTAGLAALGIGGLAIAFGAQKTIENFIGSIMVIFDQPIRIGDFCKVGDIMGTVEDIGMRSTRIRTLERTLVTIPNGDFSAQRIENFAPRDQFRIYAKLALRMDITPDQLRYLIVEIRSLLLAHPKIESKGAYAKFIGWGDYCAFVEIAGYIPTRSNDEFMEVREDVFLRIMDIVAASGATLTTPATPFAQYAPPYDTPNPSQETAKQAVRDLSDRGDLPMPKFDQARIDRLQNTIEYPSKGSSSFKAKE